MADGKLLPGLKEIFSRGIIESTIYGRSDDAATTSTRLAIVNKQDNCIDLNENLDISVTEDHDPVSNLITAGAKISINDF